MKKTILPALFVLLTGYCAQGQSFGIRRPDGHPLPVPYINKIVSRLIDTAAVTGVEIGIVSKGQVAFVRGYGYRDKTRHLLNDTGTRFYAAWQLLKPVRLSEGIIALRQCRPDRAASDFGV